MRDFQKVSRSNQSEKVCEFSAMKMNQSIKIFHLIYYISIANHPSYGEILRKGILDELSGKSFQMNINYSDIQRVCSRKVGDTFESPVSPETSVQLSEILKRAREQLGVMKITNYDGSQLKINSLNFSQHDFGKFRMWIASISYTQHISKAGDALVTRVVSIAIPLDNIAIKIESTP
jgi:hypothetical protein